jgi:hypothetical protein
MARVAAIATLLAVVAGDSLAQDESTLAPNDALTLPPAIAEAPGDAHLEPAPAAGEDGLTVVVSGGQTDWRLPDLGTSLREEEEEVDPTQRIHLRFMPLYDPEKQEDTLEPVPVVDVLRDVGFIRLFEIEIGRKSGE